MKHLSRLLITVALSGCVVTPPGITRTALTPSATLAETGTDVPSPTATARLVTTHAVTGTTALTSTAEQAPTSTVDWSATPTRITLTASIIEVTQIGGYPTQAAGQKMQDIEGEYLPFGVLNVRSCAEVSAACRVLGQLSGSVSVQVYGMIVGYPQGDVWLCIDGPPAPYVSSDCNLVVAYIIARREFGSFVIY